MKNKENSSILSFFDSYPGVIAAGAVIGAAAVVLQSLGNPPNMSLCLGCFMRDTAGGIGLHHAGAAQYVRPELAGVVFGAMVAALAFGKWQARGGSAPFVRFIFGVFAMVGVLVFLGCPWRAVLRLGGGDINGLIGIGGLAVGSFIAGMFAGEERSLGEAIKAPTVTGFLFPAAMALLMVLVAFKVKFAPDMALFFSDKGPGSMKAPFAASLGFGFIVGVLAQRTRFCIVGALRSAIMDHKLKLFAALSAMTLTVITGNIVTGRFSLGLKGMPISHTAYLWSFLGMVLCGLAFSLGGGCPGRQLVRAAEGDGDAAVFCAGMLFGAGICHNWNLLAAPDKIIEETITVGGPTIPAMIAVIAGIAFCILIAFSTRQLSTG
ncbi:MAG: YedE-related selenium metabolism membrane protein [Sedimentisphaerales bacterium]|nr:YedE-related selenium metabolism membrane protein [Sedimentisphaerales bacterium]